MLALSVGMLLRLITLALSYPMRASAPSWRSSAMRATNSGDKTSYFGIRYLFFM
jgi:hypothetical protein